jgi:molybdopterin-guanine dinucleotide biosynthesis protein A
MGAQRAEPVGALLAGGRGRRIGGDKAITELAGRPLISYPLGAMSAVLREVAVVAKPDTALPELPGVEVWIEPAVPHHPLVGIRHALQMAGGRPVLICAADLPFITAAALQRLLRADPGDAPAVIAVTADGELQPLLGCYQPAAAGALEAAALEAVAPLRRAVAAIQPRRLEIADARLLFNVNSRADLECAERLISRT